MTPGSAPPAHPLRLDLVDAHDELLGSMDWPQPKSTKDNRTSINVTDPPYRLARQHPTTPAPQAMTPECLRSPETPQTVSPPISYENVYLDRVGRA